MKLTCSIIEHTCFIMEHTLQGGIMQQKKENVKQAAVSNQGAPRPAAASRATTNAMRVKLNTAVLFVIIGVAVYICYKLFGVSVIDSELYRSLANSQQMSTLTITANRGTIYDTSGKVLAQSSTVWDVVMSPLDVETYDKEEREILCKYLAETLEVDYENLYKRSLNTESKYYVVKRKVEKPEVDKINKFLIEHKIASITMQESSKRYYPNDSLAANIIGFTNYDGDGIYGIEAYYDDYLSGTDGKAVYAKDGKGNQMEYASDNYYSAIDGNSLVLTIDEVMQHYLEKNLELAVSQNYVANRATGIIMNCKTGAIIAMATSPSYNLNSPAELYYQKDIDLLKEMADSEEYTEEQLAAKEGELREKQWKNKAITELYFPGSVFKVITAASALEEEVISVDSEFTCYGHVDVAGQNINCWSTAGHGTTVLRDSMTKSCNPAFIEIGRRLGADKFCEYFEAFGFTKKTGIDLPGEVGSLFVSRDRMGPVELASSSFGQTNKITPIQMITAYAAAINGGYLVTPYVVDKILDSNGNVIKTTQTTIKRQVISEETSAKMREILEYVVETNGGSNAYISGYRIGGKSGTSQKIDKYNDEGQKKMYYVSTFCGFAPANDPEYIMLVCVDEPTGSQYYGSAVAAPVVSAVFKEGFAHLGIYPTYTAEEQEKQQEAVVPYLLGKEAMRCESDLNAYGLNVKFVGETDGTTVSTQIPPSGERVPKGATVVLYMTGAEIEKGEVPDVTGMTVSQANETITNAGFNIKLSGGAVDNINAKATIQSPAAGTVIYKGNVIDVTFVVNDETG